MPARKKKRPAPRPQEPRPELSVAPRKGRTIIILLLCLIVSAAISQAISSIFLGQTAVETEILFGLFYLAGMVYLLGIGWSAARLLSDSRPALQASEDGLELRHLPFLGNVSLAWSEIQSVHMVRSIFLTHLCIVPVEPRAFLQRHNLLLLALNASARLGLRTNTPLSISQNALGMPVKELVERLHHDFRVAETS